MAPPGFFLRRRAVPPCRALGTPVFVPVQFALCRTQVFGNIWNFAVRYFFHISGESGTARDEHGTVLSGQDAAMLRAAVIAAELMRKCCRGYLVCALDEQGNEVARCQSSPRPKIMPGKSRPSNGARLRQVDGPPVPRMQAPNDQPSLTAREREVLTWISIGKSAWEIGEILGIAKRTVDEHAQTAARKLGAANRAQAVAIAVRDRLIEF
jgi:DNA-binding CsgD family transcriptional regulator